MKVLGAGSIGLVLMIGCAPAEPAARRPDSPTDSTHGRSASVTTEAPTTCLAFQPSDRAPAPVSAATFVVNRATQGMAARVRWALAPDSSALIVVEDPAGVENEAIPDGVMFATERTGRTWRMDSVWSASPSPDWTRVAVGRAAVLGGGESQHVDPARWNDAARSLRAIAGAQPELTADSLRAHSYSVSGMAVAEGTAATFVADVARDTSDAPVKFVALDGWRVGWSCDGRDLLIGGRPEHVQDDAPARRTRRVPESGGSISSVRPADPVSWLEGPTLDISVPVQRDARTLHARGRVVLGEAGRITVRDSSGSGWSPPRDVGPGVPLAITRHGRFVLAIAPRTQARQYESPDQAVVYRVP